MAEIEPLQRTADEQREEDAFTRLYGSWEPLSPTEVAQLLRGFDRPWWVVGGWAVDAASGIPRQHEDVDVSMFARDVPPLRAHLAGEWHVWNNNEGTIHPLSAENPWPREPVNQLWIRRDAQSPWVMDVILIADRDGSWVSRRDPQHVAPIEEVTWVHTDGVRYQRPEIVLFHKARAARPKDERDLRAVWPVLDEPARRWLVANVERFYPDHAWLPLVRDLTPGDEPAGRPS